MTGEEIIRKLKDADSVSEVISIAKEGGKELTEEQAGIILKGIKNGGEISDEALENASGGCGGDDPLDRVKPCPFCSSGRLIIYSFPYERKWVRYSEDEDGFYTTVYRCEICGTYMSKGSRGEKVVKLNPWSCGDILGFTVVK